MSGAQLHRSIVDGATLLTLEEHSLPVVRFILAFRGGAMADPDGQSGLASAHFELLLRGTEQHDRKRFSASLEERGSALIAAVGTELSLLRGSCLTRYLQPTLALAAEALGAPAFDQGEHAALVEESVAELLTERDEDGATVEHFLRCALYPGHPYYRSPDGDLTGVRSLTTEAIAAAHRGLNRGRLIAAVAGDVTPHEAAAALRPVLDALPDGSAPPRGVPEPPLPSGLEITIADRPERSQVQMRVARPTLAWTHDDAVAFWLGVTAFGGTFTSPFCREVREERGWSYVAHADYPRRRPTSPPLVFKTAPAIDDAVDCLVLEVDLYNRLCRGEIPAADLELARSYLLNRYPFEVATASSMLIPALQNEMLGLPPDEQLTLPSRIEEVALDGVGEVVARHLSEGDAVVTMVATAGAVLPRLQEELPGAKIDVVDYREGLDP